MNKEDSFKVLTDLWYCNHHIKNYKSDLISSTKFYKMKENLLHYIIEYQKEVGVEVIPISIQLKDYESLLISLQFSHDWRTFKFHQPYRPAFYKKYLDLSQTSLEEYNNSEREDLHFDVEQFNAAIQRLIEIHGHLLTDQSNFLRKSKTVLYKELKEQYPDISFTRNKNQIKIEGTFEGKQIKGSYNRKRLLELFSEGRFNVVAEKIISKM